jgi:hypothetical protein
LYIFIAHFRKGGKWQEAHVFDSADRAHDTFFVQRAMNTLTDHFKARIITPAAWFFNTDGAPSQFKNRFTLQSLFSSRLSRVGADLVVW